MKYISQNVKRFLFFSLAFEMILLSCNTAKKQRDKVSGRKRFVSLFDGKTLSGWHTYKKTEPLSAWRVVDGTIYCDPSDKEGRGDLVSNQKFKDFELRLEWKISRRGNSGIMFGVQELPAYDRAWNTGPEMQVIDKVYLDSLIKLKPTKPSKHQAGALYDLIPVDGSFAKPSGEWNKVVIRRNNNLLTYWLNGKKIVEIQMGSEGWYRMVARSKFKDYLGFAAFEEGSIAFQDYRNEVWYKNISIKRLN